VQRKDKLRVKQGRIRRALIEREVLVSCSHPFICSLYAAFQDDKHVFMVLEHAALGDLTHVVSDHLKRCLTEAELRFYASEIIAALEWVHLNGVVSRTPVLQHHTLSISIVYSSVLAFGVSRSPSKQACTDMILNNMLYPMSLIADTTVFYTPEISRSFHCSEHCRCSETSSQRTSLCTPQGTSG
jgi:serine/threonine protein kinase